MRRSGINRRLSLVLAGSLLFAEAGTLTHAYEHDPGSPQTRICSTCIAAHSLNSACVAQAPCIEIQSYNGIICAELAPQLVGTYFAHPRQRGPPAPL